MGAVRAEARFLAALLALASASVLPGSAMGQTFHSLEPAFGLPGASIELRGSGFDPLESYAVTVAGFSASIEDVEPGFVRFTLPAGPSSGLVQLVVGSTSAVLTHPTPLVVLRSVDTVFDPGLPGSTAGYAVGTQFGDGAEALGVYPVSIALGRPTLVAASGDETRPNLLAIATDSTSAVTLGAEGTAAALVFASSLAVAGDPAVADARLALIASLPETQSLAARISAAFGAGTDYLDDPLFDAALLDALAAFSEANTPPPAPPSAPPPPPGAPDYASGPYAFATGSPRDLPEDPAYAALNRLNAKPLPLATNDLGLPQLGVGYDAVEVPLFLGLSVLGNPLDWHAVAYELDPEQFSGKAEIAELVADAAAYERLHPERIASAIVPATLATSRLEPITRLKEWVRGHLSAEPQLRLPADRAGLYMIRKFSGAWFPEQNALLAALPRAQLDSAIGLYANVTIAIFDAASFLFDASAALGDVALFKISLRVSTLMEREAIRLAALDQLDGAHMEALFQLGMRVMAEEVSAALVKAGARAALRGVLKSLVRVVDVTGNVAKVAGVVERMAALTNLGATGRIRVAQSIESTTVIIGEPWEPEIASFTPQRAHRGVRIRIDGRRFSDVPSENRVQFNAPLSSDPDAPVTIPGVVLQASPTALVVAVPEGAANGLGPIRIEVVGRGSATTDSLAPPFRDFEVIPDPVITMLEPGTIRASKPMLIHGQNFSHEQARNDVQLTNDGVGYLYPNLNSSDQVILTVAPPNTQPSSVRVAITEPIQGVQRFSNEVAFSAAGGGGAPGGGIVVTSLADNENADGDVTLREAIGWASGTLARPPTQAPSEPPPGVTYEEYYVGSPFGVGYADAVTLASSLPAGSVISLAPGLGPLPALGSDDDYSLKFAAIDGGNAVGPGLQAIGATGFRVADATVRNVAGDGIALHDVSGARLEFVTVENASLSGLHLTGNTRANEFNQLNVSGSDVHGLHFDGPGVVGNSCRFPMGPGVFVPATISANDGFGVLVSGGAAWNRIGCGHVVSNAFGGISIEDPSSVGNGVGFLELEVAQYVGIVGNGGPGIASEAAGTRVRFVRVYANQGDGILLEGESNAFSLVESVIVGLDSTDEPDQNEGSGIHLRGNVEFAAIGLPTLVGINQGPRSRIAGNRDHGIWLEGAGVSHTQISHAEIGGLPVVDVLMPPIAVGNGLSGVAISSGSHDNVVGNTEEDLALAIVGHANGAGVLIESEARDNRVIGNRIGVVPFPFFGAPIDADLAGPTLANRFGVRVTDGAFGNVIGEVGQDLAGPFFLDPFGASRSRNRIMASSEAGVLLESGLDPGATIPPGATPTGGNVVQNNTIGASFAPNEVGVLLRGAARANRVGGSRPEERNAIGWSRKAGVHVDGVQILNPNTGNRIVGNHILGHAGLPFAGDPLATRPPGVGVLVDNGALRVVIGGGGAGEANWITGATVGAYLDLSAQVTVRGNRLGTPILPAVPGVVTGNLIAGAILRGCSACNLLENEIFWNGRPASAYPKLGGVGIVGGSVNRVAGNSIGADWTEQSLPGNEPYGVLVSQSGFNLIGGPRWTDANLIVGNISDGVRIDGVASNANRVGGNSIGALRQLGGFAANGGAGVHVLGGAWANAIGDTMPFANGAAVIEVRAPNEIAGNGGPGVLVDGPITLGNRITDNSIHSHAGLGIDNQNLGNAELPPPAITGTANSRVTGTVASTVPDGSLVQVFSDAADEGRAFAGEGTTLDHAFSIPVLGLYPNFTATVTHASGDSTSEFGAVVAASGVGLDLRRDGALAVPAVAAAGDPIAPVLQLRVTALGAPIRVLSLELDASGSLDDAAHVLEVSLHRDVDRSGSVTPGDERLAEPLGYAADDGSLALALEGAVLAPGASESWLVSYALGGAPPLGATLSARIENASAVSAESGLGSGPPAAVVGPFPVASDTLAIGAGTDGDGDGVLDGLDNCPFVANADQSNLAGVGPGSAPDAFGDVCQCGDVNIVGATHDGVVDGADAQRLREHLAGIQPFDAAALAKCSVFGLSQSCDLLDWVVLARELAHPALGAFLPGVTNGCQAITAP